MRTWGRKGGWATVSAAVLLATGAAGASRAETLSDAIALAYQSNPTLQS